MAVRPSGVLARRRTRVVEEALLRDEHERHARRTTFMRRALARGDLRERRAEMDRPRLAALGRGPGDRPRQGPVDLEDPGSMTIATERARVRGGQRIARDVSQ